MRDLPAMLVVLHLDLRPILFSVKMETNKAFKLQYIALGMDQKNYAMVE
jgi:hypothetical protein